MKLFVSIVTAVMLYQVHAKQEDIDKDLQCAQAGASWDGLSFPIPDACNGTKCAQGCGCKREPPYLPCSEGCAMGCCGEQCAQNCTGMSCGTFCRGTNCAGQCNGFLCGAQCEGPRCAAQCSGMMCGQKCVGDGCAAECFGMKCADGCADRKPIGQSKTPSWWQSTWWRALPAVTCGVGASEPMQACSTYVLDWHCDHADNQCACRWDKTQSICRDRITACTCSDEQVKSNCEHADHQGTCLWEKLEATFKADLKGCCREKNGKKSFNHHATASKTIFKGKRLSFASAEEKCKQACVEKSDCTAFELHQTGKKKKRNKTKSYACELHTETINSSTRRSKSCKKAICAIKEPPQGNCLNNAIE